VEVTSLVSGSQPAKPAAARLPGRQPGGAQIVCVLFCAASSLVFPTVFLCIDVAKMEGSGIKAFNAVFDLMLLGQAENDQHYSHQFRHSFMRARDQCGKPHFIALAQLQHPDQHHLVNGDRMRIRVNLRIMAAVAT
jgi:hypothetical protein